MEGGGGGNLFVSWLLHIPAKQGVFSRMNPLRQSSCCHTERAAELQNSYRAAEQLQSCRTATEL